MGLGLKRFGIKIAKTAAAGALGVDMGQGSDAIAAAIKKYVDENEDQLAEIVAAGLLKAAAYEGEAGDDELKP